jgi:hypothetical protein
MTFDNEQEIWHLHSEGFTIRESAGNWDARAARFTG